MSGDQWTAECLPHGSGQCDGWHHEGAFANHQCGCPCHQGGYDLPETTESMARWHDKMHGLTTN